MSDNFPSHLSKVGGGWRGLFLQRGRVPWKVKGKCWPPLLRNQWTVFLVANFNHASSFFLWENKVRRLRKKINFKLRCSQTSVQIYGTVCCVGGKAELN